MPRKISPKRRDVVKLNLTNLKALSINEKLINIVNLTDYIVSSIHLELRKLLTNCELSVGNSWPTFGCGELFFKINLKYQEEEFLGDHYFYWLTSKWTVGSFKNLIPFLGSLTDVCPTITRACSLQWTSSPSLSLDIQQLENLKMEWDF